MVSANPKKECKNMAENNWKRVAVISDNHGDMCDWEAANVALDVIDDFDPHYRVHLGDVFDFRAIRNGAGSGEQADGVQDDITQGLALLDRFKPSHLTLGNHDTRAWDKASSPTDGMLRDYCQGITRALEARFKKNAIQWVPWGADQLIDIGGFRFLHGYHCDLHAPKTHALKYGSCAHGHTHRPNEHRCRHYDTTVGISVGCLCELSMDYARGNTSILEQAHGFLLMMINERTGAFRFNNVIREKSGEWVVPTKWVIR